MTNKIKEQDIKALTFYSNRFTTGRRLSPIPQLSCIGSNCNPETFPTVVQCRNVGWDGQSVQWKCEGQLDDSVRFGETNVICEGYYNRDDPYVLVGSCGLEYTLIPTNRNKQSNQYPKYNNEYQKPVKNHYQKRPSYSDSADYSWVIILIVIAIFVYSIYGKMNGRARAQPSNHGNHGHGPSNDDDDSPPPYKSNFYSNTSNNHSSSNGGFWPGFFTGGLTGYLFGSNRNRDSSDRYSSYRSTSYARPSAPPFQATSEPSAPPSSSSGTTSSSTSYGSSRRREESSSTGGSSSTSTGYGTSRRR